MASACPIGVTGPTMKTSSRPTTSGGSSSAASTPASHSRGKGSVPRAISQASGVPSPTSTARVTAPDSSDTTSGMSAPGARSADPMAPGDRCTNRVMTGPSSAIQTSPAAATDQRPDAERRPRATPPDTASGPPRCWLRRRLGQHREAASVSPIRPGPCGPPRHRRVPGQLERQQDVSRPACAGREPAGDST